LISQSVPDIDLEDLDAEQAKLSLESQKRQFAPEYSQSAYDSMLMNEFAIGDYISLKDSSVNLNDSTRRHMVTLLEALNLEKDYKEETLFLATSLADRYLVNLAIFNEKPPCLIQLAIVCTLMSAKLE